MSTPNIYEKNPVYETTSFLLRLVSPENAPSLLACYSEKKAVAKVNAKEHRYVRFAIIPKTCNYAVGTIEIFGGESGILRIDIAPDYNEETYVEEFLRLAVLRFIRDFQIVSLKIKASNTPERIPLLVKYGFVPSKTFRPELGYYERPVIKSFDADKGIAFCGLACCVCSENQGCAGCRKTDCPNSADCKHYHCCKSRNLEGCWECDEFPCDSSMFVNPRVKAFAKYIAKNGTEDLIRSLKNNEEHGVIYHYPGQLTGDYDLFQSEEEIMQFISSSNEPSERA